MKEWSYSCVLSTWSVLSYQVRRILFFIGVEVGGGLTMFGKQDQEHVMALAKKGSEGLSRIQERFRYPKHGSMRKVEMGLVCRHFGRSCGTVKGLRHSNHAAVT